MQYMTCRSRLPLWRSRSTRFINKTPSQRHRAPLNNQCLPKSRKPTADVSQAASKKEKADCNSTGNANTDNGNESDPDLIEILGTESKESDDDEELLKEIEQEYDCTDKMGPDVNKNLANIINKRYTGKLTENKLKEKLELYARPGNFEKLKAPEVNHEIWGKLKTPQKTRDLRMANVRNNSHQSHSRSGRSNQRAPSEKI